MLTVNRLAAFEIWLRRIFFKFCEQLKYHSQVVLRRVGTDREIVKTVVAVTVNKVQIRLPQNLITSKQKRNRKWTKKKTFKLQLRIKNEWHTNKQWPTFICVYFHLFRRFRNIENTHCQDLKLYILFQWETKHFLTHIYGNRFFLSGKSYQMLKVGQ